MVIPLIGLFEEPINPTIRPNVSGKPSEDGPDTARSSAAAADVGREGLHLRGSRGTVEVRTDPDMRSGWGLSSAGDQVSPRDGAATRFSRRQLLQRSAVALGGIAGLGLLDPELLGEVLRAGSAPLSTSCFRPASGLKCRRSRTSTESSADRRRAAQLTTTPKTLISTASTAICASCAGCTSTLTGACTTDRSALYESTCTPRTPSAIRSLKYTTSSRGSLRRGCSGRSRLHHRQSTSTLVAVERGCTPRTFR